MHNQVGGYSTEISVVPVITAVPYTAADQVGGIQTVAVLNQHSQPIDAACQDKTVSYLVGLKIIDKSKQNSSLNVYFFNALPTVASSDNAALSIVAGEATKCIGFIKVNPAMYQGPAQWSIADIPFGDVMRAFKSNTDDGPLYVVVQTNDTPTWSVGDLEFKYVFSQDLGNGRQ